MDEGRRVVDVLCASVTKAAELGSVIERAGDKM